MFKKLLNVGKGHASEKLQHQQQQKNLFQLNEIRSYGFSHLCCLGYSASLSLLAVGSKHGLLRILGNSSVEFSYQLESANAIRQIEFIDCRNAATTTNGNSKGGNNAKSSPAKTRASDSSLSANSSSTISAKIVVLSDNGILHMFELKTFKQQNYADNTTQTEASAQEDCCKANHQPNDSQQQQQQQQQPQSVLPEYTKLGRVAQVDYFKFKPDDEDRSRRVTTLEISADGKRVYVGTEGGNLYQVPIDKFESEDKQHHQQVQQDQQQDTTKTVATAPSNGETDSKEDDTTAVNLNVDDVPQKISEEVVEPFEMIKFDEDVATQLGDDIKSKKQGAIESIKRHPSSNGKLLISYHRGLNVIYDVQAKSVEKYFYHKEVLESSCFADQNGDFFYTSHNDGSYIKWDTRPGSQAKANEDFLGQLYGPYPCKPTPKIQACTGLINDQLEDLVIFSGGMPRATYDDKNPVTIIRAEPDGKDAIKTVLDFTSKVLDFVVITRPRGNLGAGAKSTGGGGKKNRHKQQKQEQQQQRNNPIAVALAILAEEEFVVIDLLNSESYLEFALPYLNCVHSSAITCNQHYSDISDELYDQLLAYNRQQLKGKLSPNEWPVTGGKVIDAPELKSHDILLTGHEDGSVDFWDVSELSMRHLLHLSTARFFSTNDDDLVPVGETDKQEEDQDNRAANNEDNPNQQDSSSAWPPLKRVGRFDPYSDDTRLAIRKLSLCPQTGTLVVAGTGGQVLVFELKEEPSELETLVADEVTIVSDHRFHWKGREKLNVRPGSHKLEPGYQLASYVQLNPPVSATSLDLRSDWHLYAVGTSYGFLLYEYANKHSVVNRCTLNVQDFAIVSGDAPGAGAISRKKSFRKSLRESFRRLRRGRSQRHQLQQQPAVTGTTIVSGEQAITGVKPAFGRQVTTGVRTLNAPSSGSAGVSIDNAIGVHRGIYSAERQVEPKVELSSIVKCITLTSAIITNNSSFKPTLWVGTNSGQVLVYAINLALEQERERAANAAANTSQSNQETSGATEATSSAEQADAERPQTTARLAKEIQLKHRAPIIAIFTTPDAPAQQLALAGANASDAVESSVKSSPEKHNASDLLEGLGSSSASSSKAGTPEKKTQNESSEAIEREGAQTPASAEKQHSPSGKGSKQDKHDHHHHHHTAQQPRVLICSEEQFKVFNLPNLKPFCKFKLTAHEGLRAKKISITQFLKPSTGNSKQSSQQQAALSSSKSSQSFAATQTSPPASPMPPTEAGSGGGGESANKQQSNENNNNSLSALNNNHTSNATVTKQQDSKELMNAKFGAKTSHPNSTEPTKESSPSTENESNSLFEPYMVCMSNQGDCAIYSVPDLKRQAQIQVCKREDVNGITSTMLTNYGEGYYLKSSSNFLRFSISSQRVPRVLSVV